MLAVAFVVDPSQWRELHWVVVDIATLVALCCVAHLTDHSVLVATPTALEVTHSHSDLIADGNGGVPLVAAATL